MNNNFQLYLASNSPRRKELLTQIGIQYKVLRIKLDEEWDLAEEAESYVLRLAQSKAQEGLKLLSADEIKPVLAADTTVLSNGKILGKPIGKMETLAMLRMLSGKSHWVLTAVCLANHLNSDVTLSKTKVTFRDITESEMEAYWATGESADKAGAYAIQGKAALFIKNLAGSYSGVVGLPLFETANLLAGFGIDSQAILQSRID
jgi:septum formation protein